MPRSTRRTIVVLFTGSLVALLGGCERSAGPKVTTWRGGVAPGAWVRVQNVNGAVRVARASGGEVVIVATRSASRGRPEPVRVLTERRGPDVVSCVTWGDSNRCGSSSRGRPGFLLRLLRGYGSTDLSFVVALPAGVRLDVQTVNGRVTVADAAGEVVAHTVNGSVTIGAAGGPVRAESVNGSVSAQIASLAPNARVRLGTVNGSVTALLPASLDASVAASTTNGHITSAFGGLTVPARAHAFSTTLGRGAGSVSLSTVNGSVRIATAR